MFVKHSEGIIFKGSVQSKHPMNWNLIINLKGQGGTLGSDKGKLV